MNEQLRKAIEEATKVAILPIAYHTYVYEVEHNASQAKLLRVIELLVQQRDYEIKQWLSGYGAEERERRVAEWIKTKNAELIAALEREGEGM